MVMGGDSRSKGRGFKSQHRILDGNFLHIFAVKICNVCVKKTENKQKRGRGWLIYDKITVIILIKYEISTCEWYQWSLGPCAITNEALVGLANRTANGR